MESARRGGTLILLCLHEINETIAYIERLMIKQWPVAGRNRREGARGVFALQLECLPSSWGVCPPKVIFSDSSDMSDTQKATDCTIRLVFSTLCVVQETASSKI